MQAGRRYICPPRSLPSNVYPFLRFTSSSTNRLLSVESSKSGTCLWTPRGSLGSEDTGSTARVTARVITCIPKGIVSTPILCTGPSILSLHIPLTPLFISNLCPARPVGILRNLASDRANCVPNPPNSVWAHRASMDPDQRQEAFHLIPESKGRKLGCRNGLGGFDFDQNRRRVRTNWTLSCPWSMGWRWRPTWKQQFSTTSKPSELRIRSRQRCCFHVRRKFPLSQWEIEFFYFLPLRESSVALHTDE